MEFKGYQCWDQDKVSQTLQIEAEQPSDTVFLATMAPLPITRSLPGNAGQAMDFQPYDRQQFLQDFLDPHQLFTLVPIVGTSGAGKSHLVRWLSTQIRSSPQRLVIRIPKYNTNLRDVIKLLLKEFKGSRFEDFDRRIEAAVADKSPDSFAFEILTRLAYLAANPAPKERGNESVVSANVANYMLDGPLRNVWLNERGPIFNFATEALQGRKSDKATPFEFTERDLPASAHVAKELGNATRQFFVQVTSNPDLKRALLARLNKYLPEAIQRVHDFSGEDLLQVLREMRAELFKEGKELVLLIEDFALLQGLQEPLIAALVENPVVGGRQVSCSIRTAVAVTTGYLDGVDTVRTRSSFIVRMEGKVDEQNLQQFAGRYLNAARLGESGLQQNGSRSACSGCNFRPECHSVFGHHEDEDLGAIGFYPFNPTSLAELKKVLGADFNPRQMISGVLRYTLLESYNTLSKGEFPTRSYIQEFANKAPALPLEVQAALESRVKDSEVRSRVAAVRRLWGDAAGVLQAFGLPSFSTKVSSNTTTSNQDPESSPIVNQAPPTVNQAPNAPAPKDLGPPNPILTELEEWASGKNLSEQMAVRMREKLFSRLEELIPWEMLSLTKDVARELGWRPPILYWDGQVVGRPPQGDFSLILPQEGQTRVQVAQVMKWVLLGNDSGSTPARVESQAWLREWADHLSAQLEEVSNRTLHQVYTLAQPVVRALGGDIQNPQKVVEALSGPLAYASPTGPLEGVHNSLGSLRSKLAQKVERLIGVRKGTGESRFWEVQSLAGVMRSTPSEPNTAQYPVWLDEVAREVQDFGRQVEMLDRQSLELAMVFTQRLKASFPWPIAAQQVEEALNEFSNACADALRNGVLVGQLDLGRFQSPEDLVALIKRLEATGSMLEAMEAQAWDDTAIGRLQFWYKYHALNPRELEALVSRITKLLGDSIDKATDAIQRGTVAGNHINQTIDSISKRLADIDASLARVVL